MGGGPDAKVDRSRHIEAEGRDEVQCVPCNARPTFPVDVEKAIDGNDEQLEEICAPCEEEEQAEIPLRRPPRFLFSEPKLTDHVN